MDVFALLVRALIGVVALLFGRRVFWLFVALVGFLVGFFFGQRLLPDAGQLVHLLVGLGAGLVGVLFSQLAPDLIAAILGFLVGGIFLGYLVGLLTPLNGVFWWIVFIAGGLLGILAAVKAFDLALVILSALSGASALTHVGQSLLKYEETVNLIILLVLAAVGIVFQLGVTKKSPSAGQDA